MKANPITVKINDLIDEHNEIHSYAECPGCDICQTINTISKRYGFWMENSEMQREAMARAQKLDKEKIKHQLDAGKTQKEIALMFNVSQQALGRRIKKWFPDYQSHKRLEISLEEYESLVEKGMKRKQIADKFNTNENALIYHVSKLRKTQKVNV